MNKRPRIDLETFDIPSGTLVTRAFFPRDFRTQALAAFGTRAKEDVLLRAKIHYALGWWLIAQENVRHVLGERKRMTYSSGVRGHFKRSRELALGANDVLLACQCATRLFGWHEVVLMYDDQSTHKERLLEQDFPDFFDTCCCARVVRGYLLAELPDNGLIALIRYMWTYNAFRIEARRCNPHGHYLTTNPELIESVQSDYLNLASSVRDRNLIGVYRRTFRVFSNGA